MLLSVHRGPHLVIHEIGSPVSDESKNEDRRTKHLRGKEIPLVKVIRGGASGEDATWELESQM